MPGYQVKLLDDQTGEELTGANQKGVLTIEGPLPPGCMQTIWGDDQRFVQHLLVHLPGKQVYNTFDWGIRDADGYYFILGRTDDVINVAGHRLGTREIEEAISRHPGVTEVAVVGVADTLKGQVAKAFVVPRDASRVVDDEGPQGAGSRDHAHGGPATGCRGPAGTGVLRQRLPKTRSGKMLRRAMQAVCEGRDTGDLSTIEDPSALQQLQEAAQR
jgi:propionyl-CoA synthetase